MSMNYLIAAGKSWVQKIYVRLEDLIILFSCVQIAGTNIQSNGKNVYANHKKIFNRKKSL